MDAELTKQEYKSSSLRMGIISARVAIITALLAVVAIVAQMATRKEGIKLIVWILLLLTSALGLVSTTLGVTRILRRDQVGDPKPSTVNVVIALLVLVVCGLLAFFLRYPGVFRQDGEKSDGGKVVALPNVEAVECLNKGLELHQSGECLDALDQFTKAISLKQNYWRAYKERGLCYLGLNNLRKAMEDLIKVYEEAPNEANQPMTAAIAKKLMELCSNGQKEEVLKWINRLRRFNEDLYQKLMKSFSECGY